MSTTNPPQSGPAAASPRLGDDDPAPVLLDESKGDPIQVVGFEVGSERYALDILRVREINRMLPVTRVPEAPPAVRGIINLRGTILPLIDLRERFGRDASGKGPDLRILVSESGGRSLGFIVDRVTEVQLIDPEVIGPARTILAGLDADLVTGVARFEDRLVTLLDAEKLIESELARAAA